MGADLLEDEKTLVPDELAEEPISMSIDRGTNFGRYVILKPIGKGGMGAVFAAYDSSLERKVAIKVLRPDSPGKATMARQKRLLREAQAMAKLSSPNVNAVHDVGMFQDRIFVAMEYVDGCTIRQWMREKHRSWKEVVSAFLQAGQGLMAAHEAGLIHRDIKPDNILIGKDGRVRVTDFGLVSEATDADLDQQSTVDMILPEACLSRSAPPLTRTGALLGSPPYMAPEQHQGQPTDEKSDQFSFCITLYEALYGQRPFVGKTQAELADAVIHGHIQEAPANSKVPSWLRAVLVRGLSVKPENRYPSMKALLADLVKDPRRTRMRWLTWGGLALLAFAIEWGILHRTDHGTLCKGAERHLEGVWDENVRQRAHAAFLATQMPFAKQAWRQVVQTINRYTRDWVAHNQNACQATHVHGEQSPKLLDHRMRCFNRRLSEIHELAKLLVVADRQVVEQSVHAAYKLTTLDGCDDIDALTAPIPLPLDPGLQECVQQVENMLAKAKALGDAGKYKQAVETAKQAVRQAEPIGYLPVHAEALFLLATIQEANGNTKKAEQTVKKAILLAIAGKHDSLAAKAWNKMVYIVGYKQALFTKGHMWARFAEAAVKRVGDPALEAELLNCQGLILKEEGQYHKAYDVYQESIKLRIKTLGPDHPEVATSYNNLGIVLNRLGRYVESAEHYKHALEIWIKAYGPQHQVTATIINNLGHVLHRRGMHQEAIEHLKRAKSIWEGVFGPEHPNVSWAHNNLGIAYHSLGQYEQALAHHKRSFKIKQKSYGKQHPKVASTLINLGETYCEIGRPQQAFSHFQRAADILRKALGKNHPYMGDVHRGLCKTFYKQKHLNEAQHECKNSLWLMEKALGVGHPELSATLLYLGLIELDRNNTKQAEQYLKRALTLGEKAKLTPLELAPIRFALARSLWSSKEQRQTILELAHLAERAYAQAPETFVHKKNLVTRWITTRNKDTL